jgi:mannose/cellobiose epimerase-like protein (N-acyl-D-glucosamine 2-epimerase family)
MVDWLSSPAHSRWLEDEGDRLLAFGRASRHPLGFGWLDRSGVLDAHRPFPLWVTARMTHVYALAHLMGRPGSAALVDHGLAALAGPFRDAAHGGWYTALRPDGLPSPPHKTAYEHAFVLLATASAAAAGRPRAAELLRVAVRVHDAHFWDDEHGMTVEEWDAPFSRLDGYRGANANMHTVEALLAAADVLDDDGLRQRALRTVTRIVHDLAPAHDWRLPEHFDAHWAPDLDYHRDQPAHAFRPYGATVGHSLEWSRLTVQLAAALGDRAPGWLVEHAGHLFATAVRDGWSVDGAEGFVYTVDWDGSPVVRQRMHWVVAEALMAAAALHAVTGEQSYADWYSTWWDYVVAHVRDEVRGSWVHEMSPEHQPASGTWEGKPDIYHAFQATLLPRLPLAPTAAVALRENLLP